MEAEPENNAVFFAVCQNFYGILPFYSTREIRVPAMRPTPRRWPARRPTRAPRALPTFPPPGAPAATTGAAALVALATAASCSTNVRAWSRPRPAPSG